MYNDKCCGDKHRKGLDRGWSTDWGCFPWDTSRNALQGDAAGASSTRGERGQSPGTGHRDGGRLEGGQRPWPGASVKSDQRETGEGSSGPAQGILSHSSTEQTENVFSKAKLAMFIKKKISYLTQ